MKRFLTVGLIVCLLSVFTSCLSTGGASSSADSVDVSALSLGDRKLISGVYNFATEKSDSWTIYDPYFVSIDVTNEKYVFTASFVVGNIVGLTRYDFTCTVTKQGDDFKIDLTDMSSYACDKDLKKVKSGSSYETSEKVAVEYAKQMKAEILLRIANWSDDEYTQNLNKAVTSPIILNCIANNSALVFKKFISDYEIIGRRICLQLNVTSVDEDTKHEEFSYSVNGKTLSGYKKDNIGIKIPTYSSVFVYTNNDDVISLTPAETIDGIMTGGTSGSVYEVNGTIKDVRRSDIGGISVIVINE
ncbi:MAG: hypothetical protein K5751_11295 [Treponemataceae bacterium]|nr:hypothetical protein [Treponemataceae bacterium]